MLVRKLFSKTLFLAAALLAVSLIHLPLSHALKQVHGPFEVVIGTGAFVTPGLGAKQPPKVKFSPDFSVSGGGIELPIERVMATGETVRLNNTTGGDKAQSVRLLVETTGQGGLIIRLSLLEEFTPYQRCEGRSCTTHGLKVTLPGEIQGTLAKITTDVGLRLEAPNGTAQYRVDLGSSKQELEDDEAVEWILAPGQSLEITTEAPPAHKFLAGSGKLLYHLAEEKKIGPALGQFAVVGELRFTAEFDTDSQGNSNFVRTLRSGDRIRVTGGDETRDFVCKATESEGGSLLTLSRISEDLPLRSIQINDEAPVTLAEDSEIKIRSAGGASGYQSSGAALPLALPNGETAIVQAGDTLKMELFTKVKAEGPDLKAPQGKPGFGGPNGLAIPETPPHPEPTEAPEDDASETPELPGGKDVVPGAEGMQPNEMGGGWASCSLNAGIPGASAWDLIWLLMAAPLLRRRK